MRTIIAGSRTINDYNILLNAISKIDWKPTVIISGTANGTDKLGEKYAMDNNIPIEKYPADWASFGKSAGYIRNELMAQKSEALLALWDGKSKGTIHMINLAKKYKLKMYVLNTNEN